VHCRPDATPAAASCSRPPSLAHSLARSLARSPHLLSRVRSPPRPPPTPPSPHACPFAHVENACGTGKQKAQRGRQRRWAQRRRHARAIAGDDALIELARNRSSTPVTRPPASSRTLSASGARRRGCGGVSVCATPTTPRSAPRSPPRQRTRTQREQRSQCGAVLGETLPTPLLEAVLATTRSTCSSVTKRSSAHAAISQTCCHPQFHDRMDVSGRTCRRRDAHASTLDAPEQPRNRWHAVTYASPHAWPVHAPHARCQARALWVVSSITKKKKKLSGGARPMRGAVDRPSAAYQCVLPCMLRMAALVAIAGRQLVVCCTDVHAAAARRTASTATRRCSERRAKLVIDRPSLV